MRRAAALVLTAGVVGLIGGPAAAAAPIPLPVPSLPAIPVPQPPAALTPALEIVAPIAYPLCGTAFLAYAVSTTEVSGLEPVVGPALVVCGAVPRVDDTVRCTPDIAAGAALAQLLGMAGVPNIVGLSPAAETVEVVFRVEDALPAPANQLGVGQAAAGLLVCTAIGPGSGGATHPPAAVLPAAPSTSSRRSAPGSAPPVRTAPVRTGTGVGAPSLPSAVAVGPSVPSPVTAGPPAPSTDTVRPAAGTSLEVRALSALLVLLLVVATVAGWLALGRLMTSPLLATGARAPTPRPR